MKHKRVLLSSAVALAAAFMLLSAGAAGAVELVVPVEFQLSPGYGYNNQLSLAISVEGLGTDDETSTATGGLWANLYLDYDPAAHSVAVSGIGFDMQTPGVIALTDMHFSYLYGLAKIDMTGLRGDLDTPVQPLTVVGGSFAFPAAPDDGHYMAINAGVITATGNDPIHLSDDPIYSRLTSATPGTISLGTAYNIVGGRATFDATLIVPIDFSQVAIDGPPQVTAVGSGALRAIGTFTVVPEPSTLALLACGLLGLLAYAWRKRK